MKMDVYRVSWREYWIVSGDASNNHAEAFYGG